MPSRNSRTLSLTSTSTSSRIPVTWGAARSEAHTDSSRGRRHRFRQLILQVVVLHVAHVMHSPAALTITASEVSGNVASGVPPRALVRAAVVLDRATHPHIHRGTRAIALDVSQFPLVKRFLLQNYQSGVKAAHRGRHPLTVSKAEHKFRRRSSTGSAYSASISP